jgi:hypothetical protein
MNQTYDIINDFMTSVRNGNTKRVALLLKRMLHKTFNGINENIIREISYYI